MEYFFKEVSLLAQKALVYEVLLTPKPGLVDRNNSGAHDDMDIFTFMDSILVLEEYFKNCTSVGYFHDGDDFSKIFDSIRPLGVEAEEKMFSATKGINTHKGAIFIFGILCAAIGSLKGKDEAINLNSITQRAGSISQNILKDFDVDFLSKKILTYGESQFVKYGNYGIRGEAKEGFPSIKIAYNTLIECINKGYDFQISMGESLLKLMETVFDSNVVGRTEIEGLELMRKYVKEVNALGGFKTIEGMCKLEEIDKIFVKKRISPGGCADLCAATVFIYCTNEWLENL